MADKGSGDLSLGHAWRTLVVSAGAAWAVAELLWPKHPGQALTDLSVAVVTMLSIAILLWCLTLLLEWWHGREARTSRKSPPRQPRVASPPDGAGAKSDVGPEDRAERASIAPTRILSATLMEDVSDPAHPYEVLLALDGLDLPNISLDRLSVRLTRCHDAMQATARAEWESLSVHGDTITVAPGHKMAEAAKFQDICKSAMRPEFRSVDVEFLIDDEQVCMFPGLLRKSANA